MEKKVYSVPVYMIFEGCVFVKASSPDEALDIAKKVDRRYTIDDDFVGDITSTNWHVSNTTNPSEVATVNNYRASCAVGLNYGLEGDDEEDSN